MRCILVHVPQSEMGCTSRQVGKLPAHVAQIPTKVRLGQYAYNSTLLGITSGTIFVFSEKQTQSARACAAVLPGCLVGTMFGVVFPCKGRTGCWGRLARGVSLAFCEKQLLRSLCIRLGGRAV